MTIDEMIDKKVEAKVELVLKKRFKEYLQEALSEGTSKEKYELPWIEDEELRRIYENSKFAKFIYEHHLTEKDLIGEECGL